MIWENKEKVQKVLSDIKELEEKIGFMVEIEKDFLLLQEEKNFLSKIPEEDRDVDWRNNMAEMKEKSEKMLSQLQKKDFLLLFSGPYDGNDAILSIKAGAGGTDAQDWAEMLLKMYSKYIEKKDLIPKIIDKTPGKEAGIKSVDLQVKGPFAYGRFRSEHGVHRLVRISPFNSGGSRETSFASLEVIPFFVNTPFNLDEKDLKIETFRAGGPGGQHVNTTSSAVRITHLPSGIVVNCQNERSQLQNKLLALDVLKSKLLKIKEDEERTNLKNIKGEKKDVSWGNQIRSYVLHPYTLVKDHRTNFETSQIEKVLNGEILEDFIVEYLKKN